MFGLVCTGIPTMVILDKDHDVITKNGRGAIMSDKTGKVR